jgi:hypothetical protein
MTYAIQQFHLRKDYAELLKLWQSVLKNSSPDRLNCMYNDNSYGQPVTWLVLHGSDLIPVGGVSVFPCQMVIDGTKYTIGINCDMLMLKEHRTLGPIMMALKALVKGCTELGYQFLLAMPNKRSQPVFKRIGYQKIGTAYRWSKVLRCEDKLLRFVKYYFLQKIIGRCVNSVLQYMSLELWVRFRYFKMWNYGCVEKLTASKDIEFAGSFYSASMLNKNSDFLKWRYSESLCQGNPVVFSLLCNQNLLGCVIYTCDGKEVIVQNVISDHNAVGAMGLLLSKFATNMRGQGYKSISMLHFGPAHFEKLLRRLGFLRREGRDLFVNNLLHQNKRDLASALEKVSWFEGDLDL